MAGIYVHIPFCKQACYYCDFHFSTNLSVKSEMIAAIQQELMLQAHYVNEPIDTIYFGGGTPSLVSTKEIESILMTIHSRFNVSPDAEITLEGNPDDLKRTKLFELQQLGINRLSIGIQSFDEAVLRFLNRAHSTRDAIQCITDARNAGFKNISIDLIYAIPGQPKETWFSNIEHGLSYSPEHISAYSLTIEEKTVFGRWAGQGKLTAVSDDDAAQEMELLITTMERSGYEHYEISNFAKPGYYSRHNTAYWRGVPYLGVGPGAHSYNGESRQSNVANNHLYIRELSTGRIPATLEALSKEDRINDYLLTTLRTRWGTELSTIKKEFGIDLLQRHRSYIDRLIKDGLAVLDGTCLTLTGKGRFLADKISADLFVSSVS